MGVSRTGKRTGKGTAVKRTAVVTGALVVGLFWPLAGTASAQEEPVCGPPGEEVPATIVGSGIIVGTEGDDVIAGSSEDDTILGLGGNDIMCGEIGNDQVQGGPGDDVLVGDGEDLPPFAPSPGTAASAAPLCCTAVSVTTTSNRPSVPVRATRTGSAGQCS